MYITKEKGTSIAIFHFTGGRTITKYIPLKVCLQELPSDIFFMLNRGIIVNKHHIKYINRYLYHMSDGQVFAGKLKEYKFHKHLKEELGLTR